MAISIKTPEEIEKMRVAGRLAAEVLEMIAPHVVPGVTTGELDRLCHQHITEKQLPMNITEPYGDLEKQPARANQILDGTHSLEDIEKEAIQAALAASNGNKAEAARRLGVTRKTLHNKLKSYGY